MGHGFPFVNLQNIFGSNVVNVNELGLADATKKQLLEYSLLEGDVLFVRSSVKLEGVGEAALVPENLENTTYSGFIIRFRDEYGLNNDFKKYIFGTKKVRNQIMAQATNSANKNISQGVLENLTVEVPSFDEQAKIGKYFSNLDNLITLHQSKQINRKYIEKRRISMSGFNKELEFESALIAALQSNGWEKQIIKNPTEDQLIQNWADILFENNREIDRLNDCPLIREEMDELIDQIKTLRTPLALNGFINGKTVSITRKNPDDTLHYGKEVSLKIYDRMEIAAGQSRYQIVEQPIFKRHEKVLQDRRGDIMLLINGMPVFHIELKKTGVPVSEATN